MFRVVMGTLIYCWALCPRCAEMPPADLVLGCVPLGPSECSCCPLAPDCTSRSAGSAVVQRGLLIFVPKQLTSTRQKLLCSWQQLLVIRCWDVLQRGCCPGSGVLHLPHRTLD